MRKPMRKTTEKSMRRAMVPITAVAVFVASLGTAQVVSAETTLCTARGNVDQKYVDEANRLLGAVPEELLQMYADDGWAFEITDENIAQTYFAGQYNSVKGFTDLEGYYIRIEDRDEAVETATIHEFGHYLDWKGGMFSATDAFSPVYKAEYETSRTAYNVNFHYDRTEMFANGVYEYFRDGDLLKENCPRLYNFVDRVVSDLIGQYNACSVFSTGD